tara:strand:- start:35 stop:496 length:462 start_codon:yes stop_codon:yes gene_type:complete
MEIENFENYLIYNDGRVFNKKKGIFLKTDTDNRGYKRVRITINDKVHRLKIHRLVAKYYCINEKPEEYNVVDHIDRNTFNNHYTNLRWCNHRINNENKAITKRNKLGHQHICYNEKYKNPYIVQIRRNSINYRKIFKTLEEAIEWRDNFLNLI